MVRFLHISETPIREWRKEAGRVLVRSAKPAGFWMAPDLAWVALMDRVRTWSPRPDKEMPDGETPGQILAAYGHVFEGRPVPAPAEGETVHGLRWRPHYVYEVNLPEDVFSTDITAPSPARIFRLTRANFDAFLAAYDAFRLQWAETDGLSSLATEEALKDALTKSVDAGDAGLALTKQIRDMLKKPNAKKDTITSILNSKEDRKAFLLAVFRGELILRNYTAHLVRLAAWQAFVARLKVTWGGLDFAKDLFTEDGDDPELAARSELLRRLDAPSAVLFAAGDLLKTDPPLRAILVGADVRVDAPPGVPVYRFATTDKNELRVIDPEPEPSGAANAAAASSAPTGKGRRRTRRRVFKNPKTLKKRIR